MDKQAQKEKGNGNSYIDLSEALSFWIVILAIALIINILIINTSTIGGGTPQYTLLVPLYQFILYGPGTLILPLIAGAVTGIEVGKRARNANSALKIGLLNSIYGAIIYVIAIVIIFEIITYALPASNLTLNYLIFNWILLPAATFVIVTELLAVLSQSRKM